MRHAKRLAPEFFRDGGALRLLANPGASAASSTSRLNPSVTSMGMMTSCSRASMRKATKPSGVVGAPTERIAHLCKAADCCAAGFRFGL
jgi:hypothetical protein